MESSQRRGRWRKKRPRDELDGERATKRGGMGKGRRKEEKEEGTNYALVNGRDNPYLRALVLLNN